MDKKDVRIVFLGTPEIAAQGLSYLLNNGFNVVGVVSQPDAPRGRGKRLSPSSVSQVALDRGIPLHRPLKLNKDYGFVEELHPDLLLTYAYGQILSTKVLALSSKFPPLNVHASDLPRLRGASPIQTSILEGDTSTAVCLMEMVKQMDAGRVFARIGINIDPEDDSTALEEKVSKTACELLGTYLPRYFDGELVGEPQDESQVTFCHMFSRKDEYLDPGSSPEEFVNRVRAFSSKPGAFLVLGDGTSIKVYRAIKSEAKGEEGRILSADRGHLILGVNGGSVELLTVQKQGHKPMAARDFLNGTRGLEGMRVLRLDEVFKDQEEN